MTTAQRHKSIVLLSGGMDSTVTLYQALRHSDVACIVHYNYGQRGHGFEWRAAKVVADHVRDRWPSIGPTRYETLRMQGIREMQKALRGRPWPELDPSYTDHRGLPLTFVPGRNLIFLAHASTIAYYLDARDIYIGVTGVDNAYPDCTSAFVTAASSALTEALGHRLVVQAPLLYHAKSAIVKLGESLFVPWKLTRSCYGDDYHPCGKCDSCLKRAKAFIANDLADPIYSTDKWEEVVDGINAHTEVTESDQDGAAMDS